MKKCHRCGNDHDLPSKEWTLAGHLCAWRSERPDEWTMDEFIQKALKMEKILNAVEDVICWEYTNLIRFDGNAAIEFSEAIDKLEKCFKEFKKEN